MQKKNIVFIFENKHVQIIWQKALSRHCNIFCYDHPNLFFRSFKTNLDLIITSRYFDHPNLDVLSFEKNFPPEVTTKTPWVLCWPGPSFVQKSNIFSVQISNPFEVNWPSIQKTISRIKNKKKQSNQISTSTLDQKGFLLLLASKAPTKKEKEQLYFLASAALEQKTAFLKDLYNHLQVPRALSSKHWLLSKVSSSKHVLSLMIQSSLQKTT